MKAWPLIEAIWTRTIEPVQEPLTIAEAKQHCSITQDDDNALVDAYLRAARGAAESYLFRALFTQTWKLQLSAFAETIWLPMAAPLQSVSSVTYYDTAGVLQTLSASYYTVGTTTEPGRILRAPAQAWPAVQADRPGAVFITYVCGWSDVNVIPELIKQGMRLHIAASDADRQGGSADAIAARKAAEHLWEISGRAFWREPELCRA